MAELVDAVASKAIEFRFVRVQVPFRPLCYNIKKMNFKIFLEKNFIKYMFFSLTGRIGRSYWWFSQIYLILVSFVIASLISPLEIALLNIVFNLIFTAGFFVSAKDSKI